jgi:ribosomal protein S18 acetylase RimI-like enzyme
VELVGERRRCYWKNKNPLTVSYYSIRSFIRIVAIRLLFRRMTFYRLLSDAHFTELYECFLSAFSDYEVDMRMPREQFQQRLARDGISLEISAGAFEGDRMIGFCLNALGDWQGKATAYDGGTGIVPGYRGRGIGKELFLFVEGKLKGAGVVQYLLEVLTSNVRAATLYRKLGFVESRRLAVFRSDTRISRSHDFSIRDVEEPDWQLYQSFWDGYPSWQNSIAAVERAASDRKIIGAYVDEECAGYGVVFVPAMNLMQLAVSPSHRRVGIGSAVLASLENSKPLKINNIDEVLEGSLAFYKANGYKQVLGQYEMMKTL